MSSSTPTRDPYRGSHRKLVLAFDIGTTYSGVSYSILEPGQIPQIKGVTRFPCYDYMSGGPKVPTVIYYDQLGQVQAVGFVTESEGVQEMAKDKGWIKAEWFKLHLDSRVGVNGSLQDIPPLPLNKSAVDVVADFMGHLFHSSASFIQDTHANGLELWRSVERDIDFVLSHPNGWEGNEQSQMRKAAVLARLIPDNDEGHARLSFVTEGEASLRFAIYNGLPLGTMENGGGVVIVDAGGGTIDTSFYAKKTNSASQISSVQPTPHGLDGSDPQQGSAEGFRSRFVIIFKTIGARIRQEICFGPCHEPLEEDNEPAVAVIHTPKARNDHVKKSDEFEEITPSQSRFQGSVFVTIRARLFLQEYVAASKWSEYLEDLTRAFDKSTKLRFRSDTFNEPQYIKFGKGKDNDAAYNIRFGQLKLQGSDVAVFFQPSIDSIINVIVEQLRVSPKPISHVVLVGGFAASDWLFDSVNTALAPRGLVVLRPESHV